MYIHIRGHIFHKAPSLGLGKGDHFPYIHNGYKEYLSPTNFVVVVVSSSFFCLFDCLIDGLPVQFFMEVEFSISPAELTYFSVSHVFTSRMILEVPR